VMMLCLPPATFAWLAQSRIESEPAIANGHSFVAMIPLEEFPAEVSNLDGLQTIFLAAWLLGVTLLAARLFIAWLGTLWLRGERLPLPLEISDKLGWLERRLNIAARGRVFLSSRVDEAIAIGCWRPLVLLPVAWATELPPAVLEAVIAHELAHIRRLDLWATWLQRVAETLLFYHPAVWWVSRRISIERELCCDELAVSVTSRRTEYAQALETIARRKRTPSLALSTSFGGGNMNLLERVRSVLSGGNRQPLTWSSGAIAGLTPILAFAALMGWSALHLNALADDDEKEPKQVAKDNDGEKKVEKKVKPSLDEAKKISKEEAKQTNKGAPEDFNLDKFKPENEREAQLVAVIRQLQSQIKHAQLSEDEQRALKEKIKFKMKEAGGSDDQAKAIAKEQAQKEYGIKKKSGEEDAPKKGIKGEEVKKGEKTYREAVQKGENVNKGDAVKENPKFQKEPGKKGEEPAKQKFNKGENPKENPKFQKDPMKKGEEPAKEKFNKGENPKEYSKFQKELQKDPNKGEKGEGKKEFRKGEPKKQAIDKGKPQKEFQKGENKNPKDGQKE
jgi:beta-lactamase regulating signal transducer with metallopeptidase domain